MNDDICFLGLVVRTGVCEVRFVEVRRAGSRRGLARTHGWALVSVLYIFYHNSDLFRSSSAPRQA